MNMLRRIAFAFFILALTATTGALAGPPVATLTMPTPFASSPVLAWSWGASNSGSSQMGGGAGKANVQDLSLTRSTDGQSPLFFDAVAKGTHFPSVVLASGSVTITLGDVIVTSYSTGASDKSQTENISLNFARVAYSVNGVTREWDSAGP